MWRHSADGAKDSAAAFERIKPSVADGGISATVTLHTKTQNIDAAAAVTVGKIHPNPPSKVASAPTEAVVVWDLGESLTELDWTESLLSDSKTVRACVEGCDEKLMAGNICAHRCK